MYMGRGEIITQQQPLGTGRGLGLQLRPAGGGGAGVRIMEAGRGRKGPSDGRTPGADRGIKGGATRLGETVTGSQEELLGTPGMGGKR